MVHAPSFNPIPPCYIPHPHGSPPSAPLPPSPLRLAPLAVGAAVPLPRRRCGLRPPPASASPPAPMSAPPPAPLPTPPVAGAPPHFLPQQGDMVPRLILQPHPSLLYPHTRTARRLRRLCPSQPFRLAPLAVGAPVPHPCRRCGLRPPPASASPPCSDVHTTASATTVASGRWRSLHTSFPNKAAWSMPHPSTPSLPATSLTLTARRLRRLCPSQPFRLAPLAVGAPVPLPRRRCGLRPPPASASPPCSDVHTTASATTVASGRRRSLHTSFPNKAAWSMPHPSTPSLPATSPALTARRPQPLRLAPLVVDTAVPHPRRRRRLRPPPASASPPAPISTPPRAPLPTPPVARAPPHFLPQQGDMVPRLIVQPHPSLLYPHTRTARRLRRLCPSQPFRLAPLAVGAPVPLPRRRCGLRPPPASASPPCSDVHTTASATTVASGRRRSLHTSFPNKAAWSMPHPSTPSLPATSLTRTAPSTPSLPATSPHSHGSPPSAPLPPSTPPPRSARRRHRRPASASPARASPATGFRIPPLLRCPHHCGRHCPRLRSLALPPHSLPQQGAIVHAHSFNTIPPCYIPSPARLAAFGAFAALTPPPRSARRRHRRPASASPVRASPASGFRIPPCSVVHTTASATTHTSGRWRSLRTPFANKAASSMPTPSTPSLPATSPTRTARRLRRLCRPHPSASLRSPSAPPSRIRAAGAGFARLRLPHPPPLRYPHHRGRHYPRLRSLALPPHSLPQQGAIVRASSFNPIPHCYIPSPARLAAFGAFAALNPSASLRSPSAPPSHFRVAGAGFARLRLPHPPLPRCPHHRGRHYPRLRSLALPPHSLPQQGAIVHAHSFNTIPPCYIPHPHGSPPSAPLPLSTPPPRSARRRLRRPASTPPARASPASGFPHPPLLRCPHHRQRHYPRLRSLALPPRSLRQQGGMVRAPSFNPIPHCYIPSPARLAAFGAFAALNPPPRSARRRHRRPASASPVRASPASGFRIPPCSVVHTTASATTHTSGRWHSLHTSFPNKAPSSMPTPSTPSLPATSPHPHGSPPSAPLPPSPLRLTPLAVGAAVPHPRRRRGLRPPPASASPPAPISTPPRGPLPTPPVAGAPSALPSPTRRHGPGPILQHHPSLLHPLTRTARRLRCLCRPQPLRLAPLAVGAAVPLPRRRCGLRPPPASASPPAPMSAPPPAPLPSPPAACFARLPSAPSAVTATQSPWRLLSAGLAGVDSPSLIPWDFSFLTAGRACGLHTTGSRRFGGSAALPPHRLAQSPLHLMRHRSDTGLHITIVARNAFHVHHASDHHGTARRVPVTTPMVMPPVNLSVMTMMARQLDRSADFMSKGLDPSLPDRATPSSPLRRLASSTRYPSPLRSLALPAHFACPHPTTRREHPASRPALRHSRRVVSPPSDLHPCPPTGSCRSRRPTPGPGCPLPRRRRCGLRPSPAAACRPAPVSASLRAPPPSPPAACFARLPAAPSAVTATQSPCRLLSAGLAGVDSPLAFTLGFIVPDRVPRLWFSHLPHRGA